MASDQEEPSSLIERLIYSRNMDLASLLPIITTSTNGSNSSDPDQDSTERSDPLDRIILINPASRSLVVIEGSSSGVDSLLLNLLSTHGQPPASKASIEAMPSVEAKEEGDECVICLEEMGGKCNLVKEMPCKHSFHGECIEKWLKIHGSCPVCRYKMPVDDDEGVNLKNVLGDEVERVVGRRMRREFWVTLSSTSFDNNNTSDNTTSGEEDTSQTDVLDSPQQ